MKEPITIEQVIEEYTKVFRLTDTNIIPLVCAVTIGTMIDGDPIWLMVISAPSAGKSEIINAVSGVPYVHQVSTLTENTFLSGMRAIEGKEPSLLHKIGNIGMITMKDYTSILTMRSDKRDIIISQMREIFDGHITKKTGNNQDREWRGKLNFLGGVTDMIYLAEEASAGMGRRVLYYSLPELGSEERILTAKIARQNTFDIKEKRKHISEVFKNYIMQTIDIVPPDLPPIDDDFSDEIIRLSDFVSTARTPTTRDFHGKMQMANQAELPMRISQQLHMIATVLHIMFGGIDETSKKIIYKICLDSIPSHKRLALRHLAAHKSVTKKGLAEKINYPTDTVGVWLEDLNVQKICTRNAEPGTIGPDKWSIREEYRELLIKFDGVKYTDDNLFDASEVMGHNDVDPSWVIDDPGVLKDMEREANDLWNNLD